MSDLVHWKPNRGERKQPEKEERYKVDRVGSGPFNPVLDVSDSPTRPDSGNHELDAVASDPALNSVPDTCHRCAVEDWPERAIDSEGGASYDGETNVVCCAYPSRRANKATSNEIADPEDEDGS